MRRRRKKRQKQSTSCRVTQATAEDSEALFDIAMRASTETKLGKMADIDKDAVRSMIAAAIGDENGAVLIARNGGPDPVGLAAAVQLPMYFAPTETTVKQVVWWVDEEHRRKGVGKALFAQLEKWARQRGAKSLTMASVNGSTPVAPAYLRAGYRLVESAYTKGLK